MGLPTCGPSPEQDTDAPEPTGWEIAIAVNAVVKGALGALGQSGHVCRRAIPVQVPIDTGSGYRAACTELVASVADTVADGDTIVVADKVLALAEGRVGPPSVLSDPDPKTIGAVARRELAQRWTDQLGIPVSPTHLLLADEHVVDGELVGAVLGCSDHNRLAHDLAVRVRATTGVTVDVVVSDTDTGLDVRAPLISTVTFGATPLGATAGLTLYECMRCACAAEFVRGHDLGIPVVVCRPARRCTGRPGMGEHRGYDGMLDLRREPGLTHA